MESDQDFKTTTTLVDALQGPDTPLRRQKVARIATFYHEVFYNIVRLNLSSEYIDVECEDISTREIARMLAPNKNYFKSYRRECGKLRSWLRLKLKCRTIDYIRKKKIIEEPDEEAIARVSITDNQIDEEEYHHLFVIALKITKQHFQDTNPNKFEIFRAVRSESHKIPEDKRRQNWSEWTERQSVKAVRNYIREIALVEACKHISEDDADALELAQATWDLLMKKQYIHLPE
ncbi:MAG: hypothetical protein ACPGES_01485 [Coraliomargarita sp.]